MKPVSKFADYNKDIILGNLIQAETHLKNLTDNSDPNFSACVNKHLLEAEMELSELTAHEPEGGPKYRELMILTRKLRKDNISKGLPPREMISRTRVIRDMFEKHVPGHDVEGCRACDPAVVESLTGMEGKAKDLNRESNKDYNMDKKVLTQGLIGTAVGKGIHYGTGAFVPGFSFGVANKTILNLAIGLGIDLLALLPKKDYLKKMAVPAVSAANYLIVQELGDLMLGMIPAPAAVARMAVAPVSYGNKISVAAAPAVGVPAYANGRHIFVD